MERKLMQKTIAAIMAVALLGGAVTAPVGSKSLFGSALTANAEDTSTASFDEVTMTLTLSGNVVKSDVQKWGSNNAVKKVVCEEGTVFPQDCRGMFYAFRAEEMDLANADTSKVTDMYCMFNGCTSIKKLDLSSWNTGKVIDMGNMFSGINLLTDLDVSGFDTTKVQNFAGMFSNCS